MEKNLLILLLFAYNTAVACFVADWSKFTSMKHSGCVYISIVGSSSCQCGFANHNVVESVNKILLFFFSLFHKYTNRILSRKNLLILLLFRYIYVAVACFVTDLNLSI